MYVTTNAKQIVERTDIITFELISVTFNLVKLGISNGLCEHLRAFASTRAVRIFFRARAVINFLMRAASTLETL